MSILSLCNRTATLTRGTVTSGTIGGQVTTFANVSGAVSFSCSIQPIGHKLGTVALREKFAKPEMDVDHVIYTPNSTESQAGDVIIDDAGIKYVVQGFGNQAGRNQLYGHYAKRIDQ